MALSSCGGRPSNVLPEDKMVGFLVDMELTEAYVNTQVSISNKERLEMGKRVMQAHGVTEEQLDTTLAWYGRNMDEYSKLYDKVDAELLKRQKKYTEIPNQEHKEPDNLWPYTTHLLMSPLSGEETFVFSLPNIEAEKGTKFQFSFQLPNTTGLKGTLGVEYKDGGGESFSSNFSSKKHIDLELHSDTSKLISRIFGILELKEDAVLPLYIDSISLRALPFDSLEYRNKRRNQKSFGVLRQQKVPEKKEEPDSIGLQPDSIVSKTDSLKNLPVEENKVKKKPMASPAPSIDKSKNNR